VLVDTGIGRGQTFIEQSYRARRPPLADALAEHGVEVSAITCVVNTHLHFDHCGQNALLAARPTWVQRREHSAALAPGYTVREWFEFAGADLRLVDGDLEILPGVRLLSTPGHTPGHQSVVVEQPGGSTVIAGQAAYSCAEFCAGADPSQATAGLEAAYRASLERIRALRPRQVLFSHDDAVWRPDSADSGN
jgi:glyoxylase-like metal-dependent hydrolase (beta-lactamase superfamily II)